MITCHHYGKDGLEEEVPFSGPNVKAALEEKKKVWLNAVDPTEDELRELRETFGLHPLSIEDSSRWGQRSKIEFYPDYVFLVAHGLGLDEREQLVDSEIHVFARQAVFLITVRRAPLLDLHPVYQRAVSERDTPHEGIGFLLYLLLDQVVDGYLDTVDRLEDLADDIEQRVSDDDLDAPPDSSRRLSQDIFLLRQTVVRMRRLGTPMREVVDVLLQTHDIVTPSLAPYYRDVLDHVIRTAELSDNVRDLLTSARELQLAQVSNRLNVVMKKLTAWGAILLVPTIIAGVFGMNFRHMPELHWRLGYPMALGLMVLLGFGLYWAFKRREWL